MNMFWSKSETRSKKPSERDALRGPERRLADRVVDLFTNLPSDREYSFAHLVQKLSPPSPETLARVLAALALDHVIDKVIRVESRGGGGIKDFASLQDVPARIEDWQAGTEIVITPSDLKVLFKPHRETAGLEQ